MELKPPVVQFPAANSVQRSGNTGRSKVALQPGHSLMDWIRLGNTGVDLAGTGGKILKVTPEELAKHTKPDDAWIALKGKVYNISKYANYHPGGHDELFRGAGIDATDLFNSVHRWVNFDSMLKKCLIGRLVDSTSKSSIRGSIKSGNSLFSSPKLLPAPPKATILPSVPKLDWFQNNDIVSIIVYTRSKSVNANSVIINCPDGLTFYSSIFLPKHVYVIHIELEQKITPSYNVKVSADSGAVEIILKKENSELHWTNLGKLLANHKTFLPHEDRVKTCFSCSLMKKEPITHDTYLFTFKLPEGCRMHIPIGHHVQLKAQTEGCEISRSYTSVIPQLDIPAREIYDALFLMIKIYQNGSLTPIIDTISIGDYFDISEFDGDFNEVRLKNCTHLYLIAAGTGFTPMIKLINYCLYIASSNCKHVSLIFFNKTEHDILWKDQLSNLESEFKDKFHVKHVLSSPGDDWKGIRGRISKDLLNDFFMPKDDKSDNFITICGPIGFNKLSLQLVKEFGYEDDAVHVFQG